MMKELWVAVGLAVAAVSMVGAQEENSLVRRMKACLFLEDQCGAEVACTTSDASGLCELLPDVPAIIFGKPELAQVYHYAIHRGENLLELSLFGDDMCESALVSPLELVTGECNSIPGQPYYLKVEPVEEGNVADEEEDEAALSQGVDVAVTPVDDAPVVESEEPAYAASEPAMPGMAATGTAWGTTTDWGTTAGATTMGDLTTAAGGAAGAETMAADDGQLEQLVDHMARYI